MPKLNTIVIAVAGLAVLPATARERNVPIVPEKAAMSASTPRNRMWNVQGHEAARVPMIYAAHWKARRRRILE